jgi:phage-related protein
LLPRSPPFRRSFRGTGDGSAKLTQFKTTVSQVFVSVQSIFTNAVSIIRSLWATFGGFITQYAKAAFTNILTIVRGAFTILQGIFQVVSALLRGDWKGVWDGIKKILSGALTLIRGLISQAFNVIRLLFKSFGAIVKGIFRGIWSGLGALASAGLQGILSAIRALPGKIRALGPLLKAAGKHLLDALLNGLKGGAGFVSEIAGKIWNAVKGMLNAAIRKINSALQFKISLPGPDININPPDIPQLAKGGIVNSPTLALIGEAGPEAVVPLSKANGVPGLGGDGPTAAQIERLIEATEAARRFVVGQRQFAEAVADANRNGARL